MPNQKDPWDESDQDSAEMMFKKTSEDDPPSDNDVPQMAPEIPTNPSISQSCSDKHIFFTFDDVSPSNWHKKCKSYILVCSRTPETQCHS